MTRRHGGEKRQARPGPAGGPAARWALAGPCSACCLASVIPGSSATAC